MNDKIKKIIKNPALLFLTLGQRGWFNWIPDEAYLKIAYRIKTGKKLHLTPPVTFNEKLQWLKLHDRRPEYTMMVDKYEVKKYVAGKIGEEHIIPTYGVWDRFDDIDFDQLPDQFVLKCTHDSGGLVICKDKALFDREKARKKTNSCLRHNFYWGQREWPYKNVQPRIIAEKYMTDDGDELQDHLKDEAQLKDYKIFCFDGKPLFIEAGYDRFMGHKLNVYDLNWQFVDFYMTSPNRRDIKIQRPEKLDDMLLFAERLADGTPFMRVDFYPVAGKVYFGELTMYPGSGMIDFHPEEWDGKLGKQLAIQ